MDWLGTRVRRFKLWWNYQKLQWRNLKELFDDWDMPDHPHDKRNN